MSTRTNSKHGHREKGTEVPRDKLVQALQTYTNLHTTQSLENEGGLVLKIDFDLVAVDSSGNKPRVAH
jgi:hypothetical protein